MRNRKVLWTPVKRHEKQEIFFPLTIMNQQTSMSESIPNQKIQVLTRLISKPKSLGQLNLHCRLYTATEQLYVCMEEKETNLL